MTRARRADDERASLVMNLVSAHNLIADICEKLYALVNDIELLANKSVCAQAAEQTSEVIKQ